MWNISQQPCCFPGRLPLLCWSLHPAFQEAKLYFNTSPQAICLPSLLPSLPPQPQGDEGLTLSDMDIKPLSFIYAAWGHMLKPQRQVASLSKLSDCSSHLVAEAAFPPHIKFLCHSHRNSVMVRVEYFQKPGIFPLLEGDGLNCLHFEYRG